MWSKLARQLPAEGVDRLERDLEASQVVVGRRVAVAAEREDHARSLPDHVPRCRLRGQEHRPHGGHDRPLEVFERHLGQWGSLHVPVRDEVEGDVDPSGRRGHSVGVLVDGPLVERVDVRCLGHPSGGADLRGHLAELRLGATGEEDLGSLAGEGTGHRAADGAAPSVDDGVLVLEEHVDPPIA